MNWERRITLAEMVLRYSALYGKTCADYHVKDSRKNCRNSIVVELEIASGILEKISIILKWFKEKILYRVCLEYLKHSIVHSLIFSTLWSHKNCILLFFKEFYFIFFYFIFLSKKQFGNIWNRFDKVASIMMKSKVSGTSPQEAKKNIGNVDGCEFLSWLRSFIAAVRAEVMWNLSQKTI